MEPAAVFEVVVAGAGEEEGLTVGQDIDHQAVHGETAGGRQSGPHARRGDGHVRTTEAALELAEVLLVNVVIVVEVLVLAAQDRRAFRAGYARLEAQEVRPVHVVVVIEIIRRPRGTAAREIAHR